MTDLPGEYEAMAAVRTLLTYLGEDPEREGLVDTPKRVVKAWDEMTQGYQQDPEEILGTEFESDGYDEMVTVGPVEFHSCCEHHLLHFGGSVWIGYIPNGRVVGLSKLPRLVDCFARRLQIQERMTKEIAEAVDRVLKPRGVGVLVKAKHLCVSCRGVGKHQPVMTTAQLVGVFRQHKVREEFYFHCR